MSEDDGDEGDGGVEEAKAEEAFGQDGVGGEDEGDQGDEGDGGAEEAKAEEAFGQDGAGEDGEDGEGVTEGGGEGVTEGGGEEVAGEEVAGEVEERATRTPPTTCEECLYTFSGLSVGWTELNNVKVCTCANENCPRSVAGADVEFENITPAEDRSTTLPATDPLREQHARNCERAAAFTGVSLERYPYAQLLLRVLTVDFLLKICEFTNLYAQEEIVQVFATHSVAGKPRESRSGPASAAATARYEADESSLPPRRPVTPVTPRTPAAGSSTVKRAPRVSGWQNIDLPELLIFFSIQILTTFNVRSNVKTYWSEEPGVGEQEVKSRMTRNRFEEICHNLKVNENGVLPKTGGFDVENAHHRRLVRIWDFQVIVSKNVFKLFTFDGENAALDESSIAFRGRVTFRVFNPNKPIKHGIKVFAFCDSITGAIISFEIYTGTFGKDGEVGAGGATLRMMDRLVPTTFNNTGKIIFTDSFYTTMAVMAAFAKRGIGICGTMKQSGGKRAASAPGSREKWPWTDQKRFTEKQKRTLVNGTTRTAVQDVNGTTPFRFAASQILDKCWVQMWHSVFVRPAKVTDTMFRKMVGGKGARQEIQSHPALIEYNKNMGAVDTFDRLLAETSFVYQSHKWWFRVFDYLFSVAIVQCYLFVKNKNETSHSWYPPLPKERPHERFNIKLQSELAALGREMGYVKKSRSGTKRAKDMATAASARGETREETSEETSEAASATTRVHMRVKAEGDKRKQCFVCAGKLTDEQRTLFHRHVKGSRNDLKKQRMKVSLVSFYCSGYGCANNFFCEKCWNAKHK